MIAAALWQSSSVIELPSLRAGRITLRPFEAADVVVLEEASADSLIPKITTVPSVYSDAAALAT